MKKAYLITLTLFFCISICIRAQDRLSFNRNYNKNLFSIDGDSLYLGHNYNYYKEQFKKKTTMRNAGIVFTSLGVGLFISDIILANLNTINFATSEKILYASMGTVAVGIPLWITGGVKRKKNRKAMLHLENKASLSFGITNSGIGLVLNF